MPFQLADRTVETTTTTGTGAFALGGAVVNSQAFSASMANNDTTVYGCVDSINSAWEVGLGTYNSSGNTLTRTTIYSSSNGGAIVSLQTGIKTVFMDIAAAMVRSLAAPLNTGLTATGTTQGTALTLPGTINEFTTVTAGSGAILVTPGVIPAIITVINDGANNLLIYPQSGGAIGSASTNISVVIPPGSVIRFYPISNTQWSVG